MSLSKSLTLRYGNRRFFLADFAFGAAAVRLVLRVGLVDIDSAGLLDQAGCLEIFKGLVVTFDHLKSFVLAHDDQVIGHLVNKIPIVAHKQNRTVEFADRFLE